MATRVYRLDPTEEGRSDPRWAATSLKEGCWVRAESEALARKTVEVATISIAAGQSLYSPWIDPELTSCDVDSAPPGNIPPGVVLTEGGRTFS